MAADVVLLLTWCAGIASFYDVMNKHDCSILFYLPFAPFVMVMLMISAAFVFEYSESKSNN